METFHIIDMTRYGFSFTTLFITYSNCFQTFYSAHFQYVEKRNCNYHIISLTTAKNKHTPLKTIL